MAPAAGEESWLFQTKERSFTGDQHPLGCQDDKAGRSEVVKKSWQMLKNSGKMGAKQITTGEHERNSFYPSPRMP
ncbi:MAG: hypothetical protein AAGU04_07235, partial [Anaerolineaceae bacterium]